MADDNKKTNATPPTRSGKPPLTREQMIYIIKMTVIAMVFFFVLNFYVMRQPLQTAFMWSTLLGAIAFTMSFGHVRRGQQK
jgi:hypothetical protein